MNVSKNRIIIILAVLNVIFLLNTVDLYTKSKKCIAVKRKEEILRYDAEKDLNKVTNDKLVIESKMQKAEAALLQEQLINKGLNEQVDELSKLNEALKQDLKNAMVSGKSEKTKK